MPEIQIDNPVEVVRNAIIALQTQKAALQRQTAEIDKQLGAIVELASAPGIPVSAAVHDASTVEEVQVSTPKTVQYTPKNGSCASLVMELMSDGKERTSQEITNAVKEKLGTDFNTHTLYQAMTKLTSRQVIVPIKDRPGSWTLRK